MSLVPVPGDYQPPGLVREAVYFTEAPKRQVSVLLKALKAAVPPQGAEWQHLKRVQPADDASRAKVLLAPRERISRGDLQSIIGTEFEIGYAEAAKYPARTREEAEAWSAEVWPVMWRGNVAAQPPTMDPTDYKHALTRIEQLSPQNKSPCCDECVIVDPATNKAVGEGRQHQELQPSSTPVRQHPLRHSTMLAIAAVAAQNEDAYLCQALDVYTSQEPCVMCCMALVHSRIARLIFRRQSPSEKGPIVTYKLHGRSQLNHTFEAWIYEDSRPAVQPQ